MTSILPSTPEPAPLVACTISRDVQEFDLLIEDMEAILGEAWGDLGFDEATHFFSQEDGEHLEFVALAIDEDDEANVDHLSSIIAAAKARKIKVVLIAHDVTPSALHHLLRQGADEFVPYPLPEGELAAAVERMRSVPAPQVSTRTDENGVKLSNDGDGVIIAVQGMAGGCGASTFATNLAWELATVTKDKPPRVCIIDLGLQFGAVSTYLDVPRREAVLELLTDIESMDEDSFGQALVTFEDRLQVFTSPADLPPLDIVGQTEIQTLLDTAAQHFDFVVVDMPPSLVQWSETVLYAAQVYFGIIELDMRSAQNTFRLKRALQSEDLPFDKIRFVLNRAPKFTDLQGKSRLKRMQESLDISVDLHMPDGGRAVAESGDHGQPLALQQPKNPLRKEIAKLAQSLYEVGRSDAEAA
ncbi:AAA family ATPase [Marivita geojedonensis]|uniref:Pilus assembly protein CpaE n=1 Tax=Marivita geojedonensis TaxID=1123756 RepID=A0A1X4NMH9_9RHOB|nr:AAA family ATPase [Marivita geojedonensis]OSQ51642.1 pilus assembly protein CpaE [Marivita geojedonensis]PRY79176.1 pilus assembly protein CpaE [Marivita geojedonensis]